MKAQKIDSESGFTLIEVIITLVIVAVVAAMMTAYFGTGITQSSIPIFRLSAAAKINAIMEKITAEYDNLPPTWSPGTQYPAYTIILPKPRNGHQYYTTATTPVTSGTTELNWSSAITAGTSVSDNGITWNYSGTPPPKKWVLSTLYNLYAVVYPANGYQYICTAKTGTGTSGTTEPTWPTTSGTVNDGGGTNGVTWTYRGLQPLHSLKANITTNGDKVGNTVYGGDYRVIENKFITFNATTNVQEDAILITDADYGKYLKVTIALPTSAATPETLTTLFVRR
jgi:prepilin-type N-terminal cleavage/methylation domain-containing protein